MAKKIKKAKRSPRGLKKIRRAGLQEAPSLQAMFRQALSLHQAGRLPQAEALYRQILLTEPNHSEALCLLGMLAHQAGRSEIAVELINKSLSCRPDYVEAHNNLGVIFNEQGKTDRAEASYRRALTLQPDHVDALYNLGIVLQAQGKLDEAAASYRRALILQPDFAEAHNNLGVTLATRGRVDEAVASYRRALQVQPEYAEAHNNLGIALAELGKLEEAADSFRRALAIKPQYAEAHYNLGNALRDQWKLSEADANYRQALTLQPDYAEAHYNLGIILQVRGELEEAVASYRQALSLQPDYADAHSNLLLCMNYLPNITQKKIYEQSLQWNAQHAKAFLQHNFSYPTRQESDRRLKIGYVSSDFRDHSVAYFIEPVLLSHHREKVEVYCYANVRKPDDTTRRLQSEADHWCSIIEKPDIEVAELIRRDNIDILVDLGGHTGEKRLMVFAGRPAPIQVTWLGYPNTTGMAAIDYRFTDAIADPAGEADELHSEELVRLEHGFLCYQPDASTPDGGPPPCLARGYVTFGSFNNLAKVNSEVIKVWAEILRQLPRSRLLLKSKPLADAECRKRYLDMFAAGGIAADRLDLHGWLPTRKDHLKLYDEIDVGLDPFPYNGTTTTCETLWMGVPVVTMLGDRHAGRVGASIMHHAGLEELIACSTDEYIALTVSLAHDRHRLRALRSGLRRKIQASQLMDKELFVTTLEQAYRRMWRKWCAEHESLPLKRSE
jgi:protein O-GlcNAc transferase